MGTKRQEDCGMPQVTRRPRPSEVKAKGPADRGLSMVSRNAAPSAPMSGRTGKSARNDGKRRPATGIRLLAGSPDGNTESIMLAHGFGIGTLRGLVRDGLATASREKVRGGRQIITATRLRITDAGR